jgi:dCMP deaminase
MTASREVTVSPVAVDRPPWDEIWMNLAIDLARRSRCSRDQVGAVIVSADNRVNSASYNGPPPNATDGGGPVIPDVGNCSNWCPRAMNPPMEKALDYSDCYTNHAEANALVRADYTQILFGTIYVSSTPCVACAKNVAASGVQRVVYRVDPERPRDPKAAEWFMRLGKVQVVRLDG